MLIECPACEKKVSENAIQCPSCGEPIAEQEREIGEQERRNIYNGAVIFGLLGLVAAAAALDWFVKLFD